MLLCENSLARGQGYTAILSTCFLQGLILNIILGLLQLSLVEAHKPSEYHKITAKMEMCGLNGEARGRGLESALRANVGPAEETASERRCAR